MAVVLRKNCRGSRAVPGRPVRSFCGNLDKGSGSIDDEGGAVGEVRCGPTLDF